MTTTYKLLNRSNVKQDVDNDLKYVQVLYKHFTVTRVVSCITCTFNQNNALFWGGGDEIIKTFNVRDCSHLLKRILIKVVDKSWICIKHQNQAQDNLLCRPESEENRFIYVLCRGKKLQSSSILGNCAMITEFIC